jgi:hypothetical protein
MAEMISILQAANACFKSNPPLFKFTYIKPGLEDTRLHFQITHEVGRNLHDGKKESQAICLVFTYLVTKCCHSGN